MRDTWKHVNGLVYEKELLPLGPISKWVGDNKEPININVTKEFADRTIEQFKLFQSRKIRVPVFKTHVEDPDNDRGTVEDVMLKKNDEGNDSLFVRIAFHDQQAAKLGTRVDVSAMCPPAFVDTKKNRYEYPLRHVALTSKPVVPGLKPFTPVILSFDTPSGLMLAEGPPVTPAQPPAPGAGGGEISPEKWNQLLTLLGLTPSGNPDAELDQVIAAVTALKGADPNAPPAGGGAPPVSLSYPPVLIGQMIKTRTAQINALVEKRVLSPALAETFKKKYCTPEAVKVDLSLSEDSETEFDRAIELAESIANDRPLPAIGRETIRLSHGEDANPLIKDAKARADKRKHA